MKNIVLSLYAALAMTAVPTPADAHVCVRAAGVTVSSQDTTYPFTDPCGNDAQHTCNGTTLTNPPLGSVWVCVSNDGHVSTAR